MEHEEGKESTESILENCSTKKGFARFRCNAIQAGQIVLLIFVAMIFMVIALDSGTAEAQTRSSNQMVKRLKDVSNLAIVANPGFKYRFIYEREMKSVLLERTNKVRGSRVNLNIVLRGKDKNATYNALRQMNFNIQEQAKLKRIVDEGSNVLQEIEDLNAGLKDTVKAVAEELEVKPALINKAIKIAHKGEWSKYSEAFDSLENLIIAVGKDK